MMRRQQVAHLTGQLHLGCDQDYEVVTDPLEVGDEVGGEDDAHAVEGDDLHEALEELSSSEGVQARHGLVEQEEFGPLGDRQGQGELGALATRERARLLAGVEVELRRSGCRPARDPSSH